MCRVSLVSVRSPDSLLMKRHLLPTNSLKTLWSLLSPLGVWADWTLLSFGGPRIQLFFVQNKSVSLVFLFCVFITRASVGSLHRWSASCPVPSRARSQVWRRWAQHAHTLAWKLFFPPSSCGVWLPHKTFISQWKASWSRSFVNVSRLPALLLAVSPSHLEETIKRILPGNSKSSKILTLSSLSSRSLLTFVRTNQPLVRKTPSCLSGASASNISSFLYQLSASAALISGIYYWECFACRHCIV